MLSFAQASEVYVSYSLKSLKGGYIGILPRSSRDAGFLLGLFRFCVCSCCLVGWSYRDFAVFGVYREVFSGVTIGVTEMYTRSLDHSSYAAWHLL